MIENSLRADCAQCAGLCCVALAFDRSALFAIDKAAGVPCPNLSSHDRCRIHSHRADSGYAGCVQYDCLGAGQGVTRMFAGRSWRDDAATARAMFDAFHALRAVQQAVQLVTLAKAWLKTPEQVAEWAGLLSTLQPRAWTPASLQEAARAGTLDQVGRFLKSLKPSSDSGPA